jgi:hypothetical protein
MAICSQSVRQNPIRGGPQPCLSLSPFPHTICGQDTFPHTQPAPLRTPNLGTGSSMPQTSDLILYPCHQPSTWLQPVISYVPSSLVRVQSGFPSQAQCPPRPSFLSLTPGQVPVLLPGLPASGEYHGGQIHRAVPWAQ